ncbi:MAG: cell filamentation protein Fic, partial [Actinomycetia bacterium]|nr:cell filamentation protein Fic [Actinomycetes bacterium]
MSLTPGYGETPLAHDELTALLPEVIAFLDKPILRADVYDLEQGFQDRVFGELIPSVLDGALPLDELLNDHFLRDLHTRMF